MYSIPIFLFPEIFPLFWNYSLYFKVHIIPEITVFQLILYVPVYDYDTITLTSAIATHPIINNFSDVHIGCD